MTIVRVREAYEFLDKIFKEAGDLIKQNTSFVVNTKSFFNAGYFIKTLFENYTVRSKYLGKKINDYYFINFDTNISDFEEIDSDLLKTFSYLVGIEFINIQSVLSYLEEQDKFIVLYAYIESNQKLARFLLSYSFILKNRIIFIFASVLETDLIEKKVDIVFSDAFMNFYIERKLVEMNVGDIDINKVMRRCEGDLGMVYQSINAVVLEKYNLEEKEFVDKSHPKALAEEITNENIKILTIDASKKKELNNYDKLTSRESSQPSLTSREESIFNILKEKKFITRVELAKIVWGDSLGQNASNDAIDQVISRLRRKFVKSGFPKDYIYSKKGEGVGIN